jgi:hypothetical protein
MPARRIHRMSLRPGRGWRWFRTPFTRNRHGAMVPPKRPSDPRRRPFPGEIQKRTTRRGRHAPRYRPRL